MKKTFYLFLFISVLLFSGCEKKAESVKQEKRLSALIYITGVIAGSPTYELMAEGANEFALNNPGIQIKIYEAGMNQAQWEQQLAEMVSSGNYDVVIGSNPSLPEICANVAKMFPNQKFIIADAEYEGHPQIRTFNYNQYDQSLLLGYLAGLVTISDMPYANSQKKIGFIAAQEYPLLTRQMIPGFLEGARIADPEISLDVRIVGSWADANKAAELAIAMMNSGVDVFTAIAGGAAQGLIRVAVEKGAYIVWYNTNAYSLAPGYIIGCGVMEQKKLVMEILEKVLEDQIEYGISDTIGIKEGYLGFISDDPSYQNLSKNIRDNLSRFMAQQYQITAP
ncbi:MAG: BMP family ABC transporter substrate-binding protein [Treponema sp.]|nr:BMP family ABC transporter substrate-binding protein [Treponema sp.]